MRVSAACWFDAVYATFMEAPHESLEKVLDHMVKSQARMDPDRETWGLLPEHRRLAEKAASASNQPPPSRHRRGDGRPA